MYATTYTSIFNDNTLTATSKPIPHEGYLIYRQPLTKSYDIVFNGVCVSQVGSVAFAKSHIDDFIANGTDWQLCAQGAHCAAKS